MKPRFAVRTTSRFDRLARALEKQHPGIFFRQLEAACTVLGEDPHNHSGRYAIRKLRGIVPMEGQYRLRQGR